MQIASLPRWLARLFTISFYGQLLVAFVLLGFFVWRITSGPAPNEEGSFVIPISINRLISSPRPNSATRETVRDWLTTRQAYELATPVPAFLSRTLLNNNQCYLKFTLRNWRDVRQFPVMLLVSLGGILLSFALILFVSYLAMRLFRDLADRQIFDQQQSNRLNRIGQAFIGYAMLNTAGRLGAEQWGLSYLEANGYALSRNYTITIFSLESSELAWLLMGLCILALAQVFRYGMQLRQENELTI